MTITRAVLPVRWAFRPTPLVPRSLRLGIEERLDAKGEVLRPLAQSSVDEAAEVLQAQQAESVAIGFLHSYANAEHEQQVAQRLSQLLPDLSISLSSQVCPEIREYERLSTTCANANSISGDEESFGCCSATNCREFGIFDLG